MFKKCFITVTFMMLVFAGLSFAQIDKIAIFNEAQSWTDAATATAATDYIMANVKVANDIQVYNDADIGTFAQNNTKDGNVDIIITFGYFPVSLYTPGNAQVDDSLAENFINGGDMIINTADYIFYVTEGGGVNGDAGLKNITSSTLDMWCDDNPVQNSPTADGMKYAPSLPALNTAARAFKTDQIEADVNWELEMAFSSNGANYVDPAIIHNTVNDGRVAIVFQNGDVMPRGEVMTEIINNFLAAKIGGSTAVKANDKLPLTWGKIKAD